MTLSVPVRPDHRITGLGAPDRRRRRQPPIPSRGCRATGPTITLSISATRGPTLAIGDRDEPKWLGGDFGVAYREANARLRTTNVRSSLQEALPTCPPHLERRLARGGGWTIEHAAHFIPSYQSTIPAGAAAWNRLEAVLPDD